MSASHLAVYHALLPQAEELLPYLRRLDASRWYTNRGELVSLLESRLGELLGSGESKQLIVAASGTAAIEAAVLATAGRATTQRPLALIPAYTFIATASAVEACGYAPYLIDVDPQTWALDPERLLKHPMLAHAGVIVPVAPYGRGIAQGPWLKVAHCTGVPVVIDAAAAFEVLLSQPERFTGALPVALSFQATKAFSSGEGGAVVWHDFDGLLRVVRALNFGILYRRESTGPGSNGKMSEYHAAVGLAALDGWAERVQHNRAVSETYRAQAALHGIEQRLFVAPLVASNYALLDAGAPDAADAVIAALEAAGIESRRWYGHGLHREPYFRGVRHDPLPVTDRLAPSLVGLPIACDIAVGDIERVVAVSAAALARSASSSAGRPARSPAS